MLRASPNPLAKNLSLLVDVAEDTKVGVVVVIVKMKRSKDHHLKIWTELQVI